MAELLIALAILGIIATFTIPKILDSSNNSKLASIAKETGSMISGAYTSYKTNNTVPYDLMATPANLTDLMNYVEIDQTTTAGANQTPADGGSTLQTCSATLQCIKLHNGAVIQIDTGATFGAADPAPNNPATTTAIPFNIDPDGTGAAASTATFVLFYNGRLTTREKASAVTLTSTLTPVATDPAYIDSWN